MPKPGWEHMGWDAKVPLNDTTAAIEIAGRRILKYRLLSPTRVRVLLADQHSLEGSLTDLLPKNLSSIFAQKLKHAKVFFRALPHAYKLWVQADSFQLENLTVVEVYAGAPLIRRIAAARAHELAEHWKAMQITEYLYWSSRPDELGGESDRA